MADEIKPFSSAELEELSRKHQPFKASMQFDPYCNDCLQDWPCDVIRLLVNLKTSTEETS